MLSNFYLKEHSNLGENLIDITKDSKCESKRHIVYHIQDAICSLSFLFLVGSSVVEFRLHLLQAGHKHWVALPVQSVSGKIDKK